MLRLQRGDLRGFDVEYVEDGDRKTTFDAVFRFLSKIDMDRGSQEAVLGSKVAEELFCDRPTASVILRNMEKRGWVSRAKDSVNKKHVRIGLLAAGRRKLAQVRKLPELKW